MNQWVVAFGASRNTFYTDYHTRQFEDALRANGTEFTTTKWLKLVDSLSYSEAVRFAANIRREDARLRAMGGTGNNSAIEVRQDFNRLGRQNFAVWVVRAYTL